MITQDLGGTYTIRIPELGGLFRIAGQDADAIGKSPSLDEAGSANTSGEAASQEEIWQVLREVYDPEIPVNIVDLGLVYDLQVKELPDGGKSVLVKMTLTAQGCGMGPAIAMDAQSRIERLPGIRQARVEIVWDPPWNPRMISPEGRAKLGLD